MEQEGTRDHGANRQSILAEIETSRQENKEGWYAKTFNNFHLTLYPASEYWEQIEEAGLMDKTRKDEGASELRRGQTTREFLKTVQEVAEEQGFSRQKLDGLAEQYLRNYQYDKFYDEVLPVWIELRARGYNNKDLGL